MIRHRRQGFSPEGGGEHSLRSGFDHVHEGGTAAQPKMSHFILNLRVFYAVPHRKKKKLRFKQAGRTVVWPAVLRLEWVPCHRRDLNVQVPCSSVSAVFRL